ncbi:PmoA family protein [Albibacterium sp.]|uniref:DUF6807 domain-containing protein n=1 Tax=Albibacterium sp. TaxID=2952885 RepID=UPI002C67C836|nr:PmoA family protein [Albibacterium sp.]HUH18526.1 PmoA family protein [Albibacterium sp.]
MIKPLIFGGLILFNSCSAQTPNDATRFNIVENQADKRVDITVDGEPFTSYIYPDELMKPVLYPLRTSKGTLVTRGWPMDPRPGERVDHPHHVGMWFNYGDVNGLDFWNNSTAIPAEKKDGFGTIKHVSVNNMTADNNKAELEVTMDWQKPDGTSLLKEETKYIFTQEGDERAIELVTKLTALDEDVSFMDNKEGLLGIRVARELEHPSDKPEKFTDANGIATDVAQMNNEGVTGLYRSSEGIEGDSVWATRGKWVNLNGKIGEEPVSLVILDNPENVGYPTYWHARGYGLFAANPLGQKEFSKGKEVLDYKLKAGESVVFKYKVLINSGSNLSDDQVNAAFDTFATSNN